MLKKWLGVFLLSASGMTYAISPTPMSASVYIAPSLVYETFSPSGSPTYEGATGKLAIGAGILAWDFAYLGVEGFASSKPINTKSNDPDIFKPSSIYGISIIPGYRIDRAILFYGRAGLAYANFANLNSKPRGYQFGAGIEWEFYQNLSVRAEYDYTRYNSIRGTGNINGNEFSGGIVYRFSSAPVYPSQTE